MGVDCNEPQDQASPGFNFCGITLGSSLSSIQSRTDCHFHRAFPSPATRRKQALTKEGEVTLDAAGKSDEHFSSGNLAYHDCSQLRFCSYKPYVVYCYFEKDSSGDYRLNELTSSLELKTDSEQVLAELIKNYGTPVRELLPNHTVEYRWNTSEAVLSLFVYLDNCTVMLQTSQKRARAEEVYGRLMPGFSVQNALEIERAGGSVMSKVERKKQRALESR